MVTWRPDPSFYPSPRMAMQAPPEKLAYVVLLNPNGLTNGTRPDALAVLDVDPDSADLRQVVGRVEMPNVGDELHHFGWNACSRGAVPLRAPPAHRAPLPARAGPALLTHPHHRHQARPETAAASSR